jgi:hypothetical protein
VTRVTAGAIAITTPASFDARFHAWDGAEVAIVSPKAQPPGARLDGSIDGLGLRLKVHRCRKRDDGSFLVVARVLDLRVETRALLEGLANDETSRRVERW